MRGEEEVGIMDEAEVYKLNALGVEDSRKNEGEGWDGGRKWVSINEFAFEALNGILEKGCIFGSYLTLEKVKVIKMTTSSTLFKRKIKWKYIRTEPQGTLKFKMTEGRNTERKWKLDSERFSSEIFSSYLKFLFGSQYPKQYHQELLQFSMHSSMLRVLAVCIL